MKQAIDDIRESIRVKDCRPWIHEFPTGDVAAMGQVFIKLKAAAGVKTMTEFDAVGVWEIIETGTPGNCAVWALIAIKKSRS